MGKEQGKVGKKKAWKGYGVGWRMGMDGWWGRRWGRGGRTKFIVICFGGFEDCVCWDKGEENAQKEDEESSHLHEKVREKWRDWRNKKFSCASCWGQLV